MVKKNSNRYYRKNIRITGGDMIVDKKATKRRKTKRRKTKRRKTKKRKTNLKNLKKSIRRKKNNSLKGGTWEVCRKKTSARTCDSKGFIWNGECRWWEYDPNTDGEAFGREANDGMCINDKRRNELIKDFLLGGHSNIGLFKAIDRKIVHPIVVKDALDVTIYAPSDRQSGKISDKVDIAFKELKKGIMSADLFTMNNVKKFFENIRQFITDEQFKEEVDTLLLKFDSPEYDMDGTIIWRQNKKSHEQNRHLEEQKQKPNRNTLKMPQNWNRDLNEAQNLDHAKSKERVLRRARTMWVREEREREEREKQKREEREREEQEREKQEREEREEREREEQERKKQERKERKNQIDIREVVDSERGLLGMVGSHLDPKEHFSLGVALGKNFKLFRDEAEQKQNEREREKKKQELLKNQKIYGQGWDGPGSSAPVLQKKPYIEDQTPSWWNA